LAINQELEMEDICSERVRRKEKKNPYVWSNLSLLVLDLLLSSASFFAFYLFSFSEFVHDSLPFEIGELVWFLPSRARNGSYRPRRYPTEITQSELVINREIKMEVINREDIWQRSLSDLARA
jgi:hypothetical protein